MTFVLTCPICGSAEISTTTEPRQIAVPYGPSIQYEAVINSCASCGESGDFNNENDDRMNAAAKRSSADSVPLILDYLNKLGLSNVYIERALGLPFRTLGRWKSGELSNGAIALLRVIRTYPWILKVADERYDNETASIEVFHAGQRVEAEAMGTALRPS